MTAAEIRHARPLLSPGYERRIVERTEGGRRFVEILLCLDDMVKHRLRISLQDAPVVELALSSARRGLSRGCGGFVNAGHSVRVRVAPHPTGMAIFFRQQKHNISLFGSEIDALATSINWLKEP